MLTMNVTDAFDVTTARVSILTAVSLQNDIHGNLLVASAQFTHFENAAAYAAKAMLGSEQFDFAPCFILMQQNQTPMTITAIETYLMGVGQPFAGATQSDTPA